jgi:hypothetical protein
LALPCRSFAFDFAPQTSFSAEKMTGCYYFQGQDSVANME